MVAKYLCLACTDFEGISDNTSPIIMGFHMKQVFQANVTHLQTGSKQWHCIALCFHNQKRYTTICISSIDFDPLSPVDYKNN